MEIAIDIHAVMMLKIVIARLIIFSRCCVVFYSPSSDLAPLRGIQFISQGVRKQIHQFMSVSFSLKRATHLEEVSND
jgi:hypothetical protein